MLQNVLITKQLSLRTSIIRPSKYFSHQVRGIKIAPLTDSELLPLLSESHLKFKNSFYSFFLEFDNSDYSKPLAKNRLWISDNFSYLPGETIDTDYYINPLKKQPPFLKELVFLQSWEIYAFFNALFAYFLVQEIESVRYWTLTESFGLHTNRRGRDELSDVPFFSSSMKRLWVNTFMCRGFHASPGLGDQPPSLRYYVELRRQSLDFPVSLDVFLTLTDLWRFTKSWFLENRDWAVRRNRTLLSKVNLQTLERVYALSGLSGAKYGDLLFKNILEWGFGPFSELSRSAENLVDPGFNWFFSSFMKYLWKNGGVHPGIFNFRPRSKTLEHFVPSGVLCYQASPPAPLPGFNSFGKLEPSLEEFLFGEKPRHIRFSWQIKSSYNIDSASFLSEGRRLDRRWLYDSSNPNSLFSLVYGSLNQILIWQLKNWGFEEFDLEGIRLLTKKPF